MNNSNQLAQVFFAEAQLAGRQAAFADVLAGVVGGNVVVIKHQPAGVVAVWPAVSNTWSWELIWHSEVGVLQKFCKSQKTKEGSPFGEPF